MLNMPFVDVFTVARPATRPDPYNPDTTITDWTQATVWTVEGFLASASSTETGGDPGQQRLDTEKILTIPDPEADIMRGDRVTAPDGTTYEVQGVPSTDRNPFTGWHPTTVARLLHLQG